MAFLRCLCQILLLALYWQCARSCCGGGCSGCGGGGCCNYGRYRPYETAVEVGRSHRYHSGSSSSSSSSSSSEETKTSAKDLNRLARLLKDLESEEKSGKKAKAKPRKKDSSESDTKSKSKDSDDSDLSDDHLAALIAQLKNKDKAKDKVPAKKDDDDDKKKKSKEKKKDKKKEKSKEKSKGEEKDDEEEDDVKSKISKMSDEEIAALITSLQKKDGTKAKAKPPRRYLLIEGDTNTTRTNPFLTSTLTPTDFLTTDNKSVLQALLAQHANLFQKPPPSVPINLPESATTPQPPPSEQLSDERREQLEAVMQSLGMKDKTPEEFIEMVAKEAAKSSGDANPPKPKVAHAVPRLLSLINNGNSSNATNNEFKPYPGQLEMASSSPAPPPATPPQIIPVNLPIRPKEKDDWTIRENVFAWENGALSHYDMYIRNAQFDLAEVGGYEQLNPAAVDEDSDMGDDDLREALYDFYYKFDAYDARYGDADDKDKEDGPETVSNWRGQKDAKEDVKSAQNGESGKEAEKSEESTESEESEGGAENEGYLHRLWNKFF